MGSNPSSGKVLLSSIITFSTWNINVKPFNSQPVITRPPSFPPQRKGREKWIDKNNIDPNFKFLVIYFFMQGN